MPVTRGANDTTGKLASVQARAATRATTRKAIADTAKALTAHYSKTLDADSAPTGVEPPHVFRDPIATLPVRHPARLDYTLPPPREPGHARVDTSALLQAPPPEPLSRTMNPRDLVTLHNAGRKISDTSTETLLQSGAYAAGVLHHAEFDPRVAGRIHYRNGHTTFSGTPAQQRQAAGLLQLSGTGNWAQKAGEDLFGIPVGVASIGLDPMNKGPAFIKGMEQYYSKNPIDNLKSDPFMFGLSYVLPFVSAAGSVVGRAAAFGETANALGADHLPLADIARLRENGALQHYVQHGSLPEASTLTKAKLLGRSLVRSPVSRERTFTVGGQTITAPASHNHAINLFHRAVTDRIINHALDNGMDILGTRGRIGRMVRANARVSDAVRNADLTRLAKATKGLSAAQEHAAWIIAKGHTAESYAKYHQSMLDQGIGNLEAHGNQLHLTKIAGQYLEPGMEDPKVLQAADVMRQMMHSRESFYGRGAAENARAIGSHWYAIHTRAEGLPSLQAELDQIREAHGPEAESPRHFLDQHIANLQQRAAQSGEEHAVALHAEIAHLKTLESDVQLAHHRVGTVDQAIENLGPEKYDGRMTAHPDRVGATHRELLAHRSELQGNLESLIAHERAREINGMFTEKGHELQGQVSDNPARTELMREATAHGVDPHAAAATLDARALRWARETGGTTKDFYERYLTAVKSGGDVSDRALYEIAPFHGSTWDEEAAKRLAAKERGLAQERGTHENPRIMSSKGHVVVGRVSPAEWVARVLHAIPDMAERHAWARWYATFEPAFRQVFGEHADELMRGFAVSQANDSPAGGLQASLRIFDDIANGKPVSDHAYSVVGGNIRDAIKGLPIEKGVAAKLSDFIDALRQIDTRTWMGHDERGGMPAPSDVHAARDYGFVDPKILGKLEKEHGISRDQVVVDNPAGSPSGNRYERVSEWYHEVTDHLNQIGFDGRTDWKPAEVQALGWAAIQKFHGVEPEDFPEALSRNTRTIVSPTADAHELEQLVKGEHGFVSASGDGWVEAVISPESAARVAQQLADQHGETRVMWLSNKSRAKTPLLRVKGELTADQLNALEHAGFTHVYERGGETMVRADGKVDASAVSRIIDEHNLEVTFNGKVQEDVHYGEGSTGRRAMEAHRGTGAGEERLLLTQRGRNLEGLPGSVRVAGREEKLSFGASAPIKKIAREYMRRAKMKLLEPTDYAKVDPERAARIAQAYDEMKHEPGDPAVKRSYDAFIKETMAQYETLLEHGYRFDFYPKDGDPYPNGPREAILDLHRNRHMYVFPTDEGFGTENVINQHPLLHDAGVTWDGKPVTYNDIFRAVHDVFGHGKEGVGFRADGEENAWRAHSAMYSPEARKAMTAETRGQNSWVNYGPHGEANRTASQMDTVYADQKAGILPDWAVHEGSLHQEVAGEVRGAYDPSTRAVSFGEHADAETFAHESLHAIRPSLDHAQMASLEREYGVKDGNWTRDHEERFVSDMMKAARGEDVPPVVQSVFNASLVAPPEAFYLPFEADTKATRGSAGAARRAAGVFGYGPPKREAVHQFKGDILDEGTFRTKASHLASSKFTKASHWKGMQDLHSMLWALSKDTAEEAGRGRWPGKLGDPVAIRDISQIPDSLRHEIYSVYPGDLLHGEAPDELAKRLMEEWTKPPQHGEEVRFINRDFIRPLEPQSAGAALRFINGLNTGFRFGRYLNPGYIRWLPQNLVLNLTQQGPFIFRNARAMMLEVNKLDPQVYHEIANAVSFGSAKALESSRAGALQHGVANAWAHINDHIPRMLSFLHEAQRKGYKTAADWQTLMRDPRLVSERDGIIARANKEPIDYGAMTDRERVIMKSLFAYWPWIRAASLWGLRFPFEHPYQMATYMEAGREGKKEVSDFYAKHGGIAPPYMEGYFPGKGGPVDLSSVDPWSQLAEDAQAYSGLFSGHPENAGAAAGLISPVGKPLLELITGHDQFGKIPAKGVLADSLDKMLKTFEPFSVFKTATSHQTGATPKGPKAAIEKWLGDPQLQGYDYNKSATNALKDITNVGREEFNLRQAFAQATPEQRAQWAPEVPLLIREAQIKDQGLSKLDKARALAILGAAQQNMPLATLNGILTSNKLKPVSQGDINAEKARLRSIKLPQSG